jgi:hypothetical protein
LLSLLIKLSDVYTVMLIGSGLVVGLVAGLKLGETEDE